jgi:peptidoglycan/LPS O-acetylase OafA/YrhL
MDKNLPNGDSIIPFTKGVQMSRINYYLLSIPVIYSAYSIYKGANLADSLIICALCAVIGFAGYLSMKAVPTETNTELKKLEEALKIERMKLSIEQVKENAIREKAVRDSRLAVMSHESGKQIKF